MDMIQRHALRKLQDKFLARRDTQKSIALYGKTEKIAPLGPTFEDLEKFLYPEYAETFRHILQSEGRA